MSTVIVDEITGRKDSNHTIAMPNNITFNPPGQVIQTAWRKFDTHATYAANNDNVSRDVSGLDLSFTLKVANSQVYIQWWLFYEMHYNTTFQAKRNGTVIGFNTEAGNQRWSGIGVGEYEHSFDNSSTPSVLHMCYFDQPGSVGPHAYSLGVRSSNSSENHTLFVNRPVASYGNNYEGGVSWCMIQEIAV
jgi:hypothetical protein